MDRENTKFFTGVEIENSKFKGQLTLFVVGDRSKQEITEKLSMGLGVSHVYIGGNQTYSTRYEHIPWLLEEGLCVTLDIPYSRYETIIQDQVFRSIQNNPNFNLMISIALPKIVASCSSLKVDDSLINKSNPGVWVVPLDSNVSFFTPWSSYENVDTPV